MADVDDLDWTPEGVKQLASDSMDMLDGWYLANHGVVTERAEMKARIAALEAENATLRRDRDEARETNRKLHRRVQEAEAFMDASNAVTQAWGRYLAWSPDVAIKWSEADIEKVRERVKAREQEWANKFTAQPPINERWAADIAARLAADAKLAEMGKVLERGEYLAKSAENFATRFNMNDLPEDDDRQRQAVLDQVRLFRTAARLTKQDDRT